MALADRMVATATRLIEKHGAPATLTFKAALPKVDSARPWRGGASTFERDITAVQHPYTEEEAPDVLFRRGHSRFIIAAPVLPIPDPPLGLDMMPLFLLLGAPIPSGPIVSAADTNNYAQASFLTSYGGQVWGVETVNIIQPGPTRILYQIDVAR